MGCTHMFTGIVRFVRGGGGGGGEEFGEGLLDCGSGLGAWGLWEGPQQHTLLLAIL